jgi:hypothetical protein
MENLVEWRLAGETEVFGEYLPPCHFVHHKFHLLNLGSNPGRRGGKPATNRSSYGSDILQLNLRFFLFTKKIHLTLVWKYNFYTLYVIFVHFIAKFKRVK